MNPDVAAVEALVGRLRVLFVPESGTPPTSSVNRPILNCPSEQRVSLYGFDETEKQVGFVSTGHNICSAGNG
jgi:hypothetical protein